MIKRVVQVRLHNAKYFLIIMSTEALAWRIQQPNSASLVRSFMITGFIIAAICIKLIISGYSNEYVPPLVVATTLSISLPLAFLRKYLIYKKNTHSIILNNTSVIVPTPMMRLRMTNLSKIKSFEMLYSFDSEKGLLIGLSNGSIEFIDARCFECPTAFNDFVEKLANYTSQANLEKSNINNGGTYVKRINHNLKMTLFSILVISSIYALTRSTDSFNITTDAIKAGALTKEISDLRDFYRIGSSFFLHTDFKHLFLNLICLALLGTKLNTALGNPRFSAILLGSALFGSILSLLCSKYEFVVGASGGIIGLMGVYTVICLKCQNCIPGSASASVKSIVLSLLLQIAFDVQSSEVDVFSHAGGAIFGMVYGVYLCQHLKMRQTITPLYHAEIIFSVTIGCFYLIGLFYFLSVYL